MEVDYDDMIAKMPPETEQVYEDFLESEDWKTQRNNFIDERGLECERCHKECVKKDLYVHHRHYEKNLNFEDDEDLMLVCGECHAILHQDVEFFE